MSTQSLEQRIAALEQQIAQLPTTQADSIQPNYLQVLPDGSIVALFTGGLEIPEGATSTPTPTELVAWIDPSQNAREYIQGYGSGYGPGNSHILELGSFPDASDKAYIEIAAHESGTNGSAAVSAFAEDETSNAGATVIDSLGRSTFPQLPSLAPAILVTGVATVTWPGSSSTSNPTTISNGYAGVSAIWGATPIITDTAFFVMAESPGPDSTEFIAIDPLASPPVGHTQQFYWWCLVTI